MGVFITGMANCSSHPAVRRIAQCSGVASMWVDIEERGQALPGGVFPAQRDFDVVIYVVNEDAIGSTQMAAHFAETEFRIKAGKRFLLPIDDVLDNPKYVKFLRPIDAYQRINLEEALKMGESAGNGGDD